jgi:hypothetical protein
MTGRSAGETLRMVLRSADEEARGRGDRRVGTDHLLLGLLHEPDSPAARALGVSLEDVRMASETFDLAALAAVGVGVGAFRRRPALGPARGLLPLSSGARAVVERAVDEARPHRTGRLDTGHVLTALLSLDRALSGGRAPPCPRCRSAGRARPSGPPLGRGGRLRPPARGLGEAAREVARCGHWTSGLTSGR